MNNSIKKALIGMAMILGNQGIVSGQAQQSRLEKMVSPPLIAMKSGEVAAILKRISFPDIPNFDAEKISDVSASSFVPGAYKLTFYFNEKPYTLFFSDHSSDGKVDMFTLDTPDKLVSLYVGSDPSDQNPNRAVANDLFNLAESYFRKP